MEGKKRKSIEWFLIFSFFDFAPPSYTTAGRAGPTDAGRVVLKNENDFAINSLKKSPDYC